MTKRELQNKIKEYKNLYNLYFETKDSSLEKRLEEAYNNIDFRISVKHLIELYKQFLKDDVSFTSYKISEEPFYDNDFTNLSSKVERIDGVVMSHKSKTYPIFQLKTLQTPNKKAISLNEMEEGKISLVHALYCANAFTNKMEKRKHFKDFEGLQDCVYEALKLTILEDKQREIDADSDKIAKLQTKTEEMKNKVALDRVRLTMFRNTTDVVC